jgi:uncharacterized protein (TIGR02466 family)
MAKRIDNLFPTPILQGDLPGAAQLNKALLKDIRELSIEDRVGQSWSKENYRGGYTSYGSLSDLHFRTRSFKRFQELLQPQAEAFAKALGWNLKGSELEMESCWMNIMPKHTYHPLHLHPHSVLSGAYYVTAPKGSVSLKLEDPRMGLFMNAPTKVKGPGLFHEITAKAGAFVLFESWLRHEVPPNQSDTPRISISFNFDLKSRE